MTPRIGRLDAVAYARIGADHDRRLDNDHGTGLHGGGNFIRSRFNILQVRLAITATGWRADSDEDDVGVRDTCRKIGTELQPAIANIAGHQFIEPRFEDGDLPGLQPFDDRWVLVNAGDVKAEFGKTHTRNQTHVARSDHRQLHMFSPSVCLRESLLSFPAPVCRK